MPFLPVFSEKFWDGYNISFQAERSDGCVFSSGFWDGDTVVGIEYNYMREKLPCGVWKRAAIEELISNMGDIYTYPIKELSIRDVQLINKALHIPEIKVMEVYYVGIAEYKSPCKIKLYYIVITNVTEKNYKWSWAGVEAERYY